LTDAYYVDYVDYALRPRVGASSPFQLKEKR
jgi:hypothetical protein